MVGWANQKFISATHNVKNIAHLTKLSNTQKLLKNELKSALEKPN